MTRIYEATFVTSKKEGRMGIQLDTFNQFFVRGIKKFEGARYEEPKKIWFFNASDYEAVRALIIEAFESPVRIYEIGGDSNLYHLPENWEGGIDVNSQDAQINTLIAGGSLNENGSIY